MFYYAQLNTDNICFAVGKFPQKLTGENIIELKTEDYSVLNKRYENGIWMDIEIEEEPTQLDRIEEAVNKSQQDIIDEYTLELIEGGVI